MTETTPQPNNPSTDSKTKVYQRLHGGRDVISLRIKPEVKEAFTKRCRQAGLTTCHVAEGLFSGWLKGIDEQVNLVNHGTTINQVLVRDVKRVRRVAIEEAEEPAERKVVACGVCGGPSFVEAVFPSGSQFLCRADFEKAKPSLKGWRKLEG